MTRGPRPMPTNMRVFVGGRSAQPDRINPKEPKPPVARPRPPKGMHPQERKYWREFTDRLALLRVISAADTAAIEVWCKARWRWRQAQDVIEKYGLLVMGGTPKHPRPYRNPALTEIHRCEATMLRIEIEFGLTPSSRTRVHAD